MNFLFNLCNLTKFLENALTFSLSRGYICSTKILFIETTCFLLDKVGENYRNTAYKFGNSTYKVPCNFKN